MQGTIGRQDTGNVAGAARWVAPNVRGPGWWVAPILALLLIAAGCLEPPPTPPSGPTVSSGLTPSPPSGRVPPHQKPEGPRDLGPFPPALRPEFAGDLQGMAEATRYDLNLDLDLARLRVRGQEVVHYTNREQVALDAIYLYLFPNLPGCGGWATIRTAQARGQSVTPLYEAERAIVRLPLDPPLDPGERVTLDLQFETKIPLNQQRCRYGELGYSDGILALAHFYPHVSVYDDHGWNVELPADHGDPVYADASLYYVTATLPVKWVVAASGTEVSRTPQENDTVRVSWVIGPARDFTMALSKDYLTLTQEVDGVRLTSFFLSDHSTAGQQALDYAAEALRIFQERFGPYRYRELDVVETPTWAGGMEYPGLIVLNTWFYDHPEDNGLQTVTAHEVAHQWWYNLLGSDQIDEPWLDEGLASYSSVIYYQDTKQEDRVQSLVGFYRANYQLAVDQGQDTPANLPAAAYSPENYGRIVYSKSALFFDALRQEVGEEVFWRILQRYYQRFLYENATGKDFLTVAEEVSGQDLDPLYQTWILSAVGEQPSGEQPQTTPYPSPSP